MEAPGGPPPPFSFNQGTENIKRKLLRKGVFPTPKIIHTLRKKEIQKSIRKSKRNADKTLEKPISESEKQAIAEEAHFRTVSREYRAVTKRLESKTGIRNGVAMVGKPWESLSRVGMRELARVNKEHIGEKLKGEHLQELSEILAQRNREDPRWLLDDDIEAGDWSENENHKQFPTKRPGGDAVAIRFLIERLSATDPATKDWKFSKLMKQSGLQFTEDHLLKIVDGLGALGNWKHAMSVVEWMYNRKDGKHFKSRFVYTKLLAVLGKARRPNEALRIFNLMREDCQIYPDMPAYRSIAVTLGQAGLVKELSKIIECMKQKPSKRIKNMRHKNWDPCLEPDVVVFNAVLNSCIPTHQWKGVFWVLEQMKKSGLRPNGATYGLAMEVMLRSGKYDLVHKLFGKLRRSGEALRALTYRVLVRAFWEEGKVNEAFEAVRDMEQRGVVGTASVYYELACCLCYNGRWREASVEVEKLKKLPNAKPLEVTFTGMIMSSMDGGHVDDCISIFEHMKEHCAPNIGTINAMLKVYSRNDMFAKAQELFEETKRTNLGSNNCLDLVDTSLTPDGFTYSSMLEASASAHQWEYFEYLYKEMALNGYQVDQNKHVSVLVEASRAGKSHLLEHAFDAILEAGEIPHSSLFTEMVCHAVAEHNYERAAALVNSMAHAPFQVSEKQWTDLLKAEHRISRDGFAEWLKFLCSSDVSEEATVSNLLRSLRSICGSGALKDSSMITSGGVPTVNDDNSGRLCGSSSVKLLKSCIDTTDASPDGPDPYEILPDMNSALTSGNSSGSHSDHDIEGSFDSEMVFDSQNHVSEKLESWVSADGYNRNAISLLRGDTQDDFTETTLDMLGSHVDYSHVSNLPSAREILEAWKESRKGDGIFLSSQTGSKN